MKLQEMWSETGAVSLVASEKPDFPDFQAPKGTWFDQALDFRDPEGEGLTCKVLARIAEFEVRQRRRKQVDANNQYTIVRKILANGFRCHEYRSPSLVAYSRKADGYKNCPAWLSGAAMARTVDLMVKAGLLEAKLGQWGEVSSTYYATKALQGIAQACGVTVDSLTYRLPLERLVRLREGNFETSQIDFEPTEETSCWTARLDAYNEFLAHQDVALEVTGAEESEWVNHWNAKRRKGHPSLLRPELFKSDLYRQFNSSSFEYGGRLYGGWWINTPKDFRKRITINGQSTIELDYSGCAIRMLYHERGIDYRDDPYLIEPLMACEKEKGLSHGYFREGVKAMTQALINGDENGHPELARMFSFVPYFKRSEVRSLVEKRHSPIASAFGSGAGLRLQRLDSDIALNVITTMREEGVLVLPVHDSFIAPKESINILINAMKKYYYEYFGFNPINKFILIITTTSQVFIKGD